MFKFIPRQKLYLSRRELAGVFFGLFSRKFKSEKLIKKFERSFSRYLGVKEGCVFPSSRIALLHILRYYGLKKGEVMIPVHSYPGFIGVLEKAGVKPCFVDIDKTLGIDPKDVKKKANNNTKAIIVPHHYGNPCDMKGILTGLGTNVVVIEDCAQSFGAEINGKKTGMIGDVGIFSFSRGKNFDLIGGAGVVSKDKELINVLREINKKFSFSRVDMFKKVIVYFYLWLSSGFIGTVTTYPFELLMSLFSKKDFVAKIIGFLFGDKKVSDKGKRFNGLQAELGLKRLKKIDAEIRKQRKNADFYDKRLRGIVEVPEKSKGKSIYLYYPILVKDRDKVATALLRRGIDTKRDFHRVLGGKGNKFAESVSKRIMHLPVYYGLKEKDLIRILDRLKKTIG